MVPFHVAVFAGVPEFEPKKTTHMQISFNYWTKASVAEQCGKIKQSWSRHVQLINLLALSEGLERFRIMQHQFHDRIFFRRKMFSKTTTTEGEVPSSQVSVNVPTEACAS